MKNHIYILIISAALLLVTMPQQSAAQNDAGRANLDNLVSGSGAVITNPLRTLGVSGSPYLVDQWITADIHLNNGQTFENVPAKYNIFVDRVEIVHRADTLELSNVLVRGFDLNLTRGNEVKFRNRIGRIPGEFDRNAYFELLYEGEEVGVFKRHEKHVRRAAQGASGYGVQERHDTIENRETLYFRHQDGSMEEVRLRRRSIQNLFGDHGSDIRDYARQNNLNFRSESDFVRMAEYYESLL